MGANAFLDIAIGLGLMYLVLSLACTAINEYIAAFLALRARSLRTGLAALLDVPALKSAFYDHGLIDSVKNTSRVGHPSYLSGRTFAMALFGSLDPTKPLPLLADIEASVKTLPDSNIRDMLLAQLVDTGNDLTKLRDGVATWFDEAMDRLGGRYQRNLKLISLAIGLALAAAINADSFAVGTALWKDATLRTSLVQAAQTYAAKGQPQGTTTIGGEALIDALAGAEKTLRPLPIGWNFKESFAYCDVGAVLLKLAGLLLTGLALSLGAPFWFDLLSKFMRIRGTGVKPARTEDMKQKEASS